MRTSSIGTVPSTPPQTNLTDGDPTHHEDLEPSLPNGLRGSPELPPGRGDYRVSIATGDLIRAYTVVGRLRPDGAVELLTLELDLEMEWD
jgi:hypothetical protein